MDLIAGFLELLAKIIVGQKSRWGWALHIFASIMWTVIAFRTQIYGLLIITVPAMFINSYYFLKWRKNGNTETD